MMSLSSAVSCSGSSGGIPTTAGSRIDRARIAVWLGRTAGFDREAEHLFDVELGGFGGRQIVCDDDAAVVEVDLVTVHMDIGQVRQNAAETSRMSAARSRQIFVRHPGKNVCKMFRWQDRARIRPT